MLNHKYAQDVAHIRRWIYDNFPSSKGIALMHQGLLALKKIKTSKSKRVRVKVLKWDRHNKPEMIAIRVDKGKELILFEFSDIKAAKRLLQEQIWYYNNPQNE